jgi:hypothetical protein
MCCVNYNTRFVNLISKAIMDPVLRERFLADPAVAAREFGFTEPELSELARYDARKLRAMVEGPCSRA